MQFRNVTLKRKLTGIIFLTSLSVLFLTCLMLLSYEIHSYRQAVARNMSTLADVIAANSSEILIFNDQKLARDILSDLQVEPEITAAALYDSNGKLFATYPATMKTPDFPVVVGANGVRIKGEYLTLYTPIFQSQMRVGTLYLKGNLKLKEHLKVYTVVLLIVLAGSGAVAWLLSIYFQRQISEPLLALANVAKAISVRKDFSVRAPQTSGGELGVLTDAFNSMLNQIEKSHEETLAASRAKDDFLAALSHELRTPLSPVLLAASDAAGDAGLSAETRAEFEMIRRNVELEARLIDDLLDLTRISRGKLALDRVGINVHDVLREAVGTVRADAERKQIELALDFGATESVVVGDSVRLQQVFWNVLKNAVKFTAEGGKITVKTFTQDRAMVVKVIDTGIGLNAGEIARVFDAFSQGDHAAGGGSHRFGGLGLGLAISRMLMEMHKGTIRAESAGPGRGSTFIIELPLAPPVAGADAAPVGVPPEKSLTDEAAEPRGKSVSILLVEDHEPTRATLAKLLRRRDYQVATAGTVAEARAAAGGNGKKFDLLITDIGLPDGNGYELMVELRRHFKGLKGIALTGYGMEQDLARSEAAGFAEHLTKPVRMESLEKALAVLYQSRKSPPDHSNH